MERMAMSQKERDWLEWLKRAKDGVVSQRQAAEKMGVTDRWVRKLLLEMDREGDQVVIHGLRGQVSNRRIAEATRQQAMELLKPAEWHDFGPTFASEQLAQRHNIHARRRPSVPG
jgi:DNA-binding Lrp family transcriptional regulator